MNTSEDKGWSPYLAGALSGVVIILSVWISGKYFGVSTSFVRSAGMIEKILDPAKVDSMNYFIKYVPKIDWQWMFAVGILIGAFLSSVTSKSFKLKAVPDMWEKRFGSNPLKRGIVAFIGGMILMFGARVAGG